ncbi:MAG: helix-turn-helix transcriptional regulator [bacterium]|nr:helix-turn-helix transcriptional regulator [bacterium]
MDILRNRLKQAREEGGHTQAELAKALAVSVQTVCRWETGSVTPRLRQMQRICGYTGKPLYWFFAPDSILGCLTQDGSSKNLTAEIAAQCQRLNYDGVKRVKQYAEDMACIPKYSR